MAGPSPRLALAPPLLLALTLLPRSGGVDLPDDAQLAAPSVAAPAASDDDDGKPLTIMTVLIDDVGAALPCHTLDLPPHSTNPSPSVDPAGRRRLGRHRDTQPLLPDSSHRPAGVRGR